MKKRIFISFVVLVFLLVALIATLSLTQQKQEIRKGAAGERVDLSFTPPANPISIPPNTEFTVNVLAAPSSGAKATAATVIVNFPSYLTLISITPGGFFAYPANTEMMALGISCTAVSNCRTTATGVTCTSGFCKTKDANNNVYPPNNTATQLQFNLGAACTTTTGTGGQCYPQTASGVLATIKFKSGSAAASGGNIAFNSGTQVAGLDSGGNAITTNIGFTGSAIPVTVTGGASPTPSPSPTPTPSSNLNPPLCTQSTIPPNTGYAPLTVTLHGSGNAGNGPGFDGYRWDFEGNGIWDTGVLPDAPTHVYPQPGSFVPRYQVHGINNIWSAICIYPYTITVQTPPSPTPPVSPPITPTPPVSPGSGISTLNFKIKFQAIGGQGPAKKVRVTLKGGQVFENIDITSNGSGVYSGTVTNIPTGTYDVLIKGPNNLQKNFGSVTFSSNQPVSKDWSGTILKAGDFDNDNQITIDDITDILVKFTALSTPINDTNRVFDVDGNNLLEIDDITEVLMNFNSLTVPGDN